MCQINSKPLEKEYHIGYRVYDKVPSFVEDVFSSQFRSFFNGYTLNHSINEKVSAKNYPFHVFAESDDVKKFFIHIQKTTPRLLRRPIKVFKVKLEDNLLIGIWNSNRAITTITGNQLTLLEDVTEKYVSNQQQTTE